MYDLCALGECLMDCALQAPGGDPSKLLFEGNPGGAPSNVLACAAKLGLKTAVIAKAGDDFFGAFLKETMQDCGIDTKNLLLSREYNTTLAFVALDGRGDRSFRFYRKQCADLMLEPDEVDESLIAASKIFHFGSVSMTDHPAREATLTAVRHAKEHGVCVSYDPNLRESLWKNLTEAREVILRGMEYADLVKVSEEELLFLTGDQDLERAAREWARRYRMKLLAVTLGARGCLCLCNGHWVNAPTYAVRAVDTTGAGDSFWGALLYRVLTAQKPPQEFTRAEVEALACFANAAGALSTTKRGAIPAMPTLAEIEACLREGKLATPAHLK